MSAYFTVNSTHCATVYGGERRNPEHTEAGGTGLSILPHREMALGEEAAACERYQVQDVVR